MNEQLLLLFNMQPMVDFKWEKTFQKHFVTVLGRATI